MDTRRRASRFLRITVVAAALGLTLPACGAPADGTVTALRTQAPQVVSPQAAGTPAAAGEPDLPEVERSAAPLVERSAEPESAADPCPARDTRVATPYPITGYWLFPRSDLCETREAVEAIHKIGGDTLITFGPRLSPREVDSRGRPLKDGAVDPEYAGCVEGTRTCHRAAREAAGGKPIRNVFVVQAREDFGPALRRCPGLDRRVENAGRVYHRLLIPAGGGCSGTAYDLVIVWSNGAGTEHLIEEAAAYGMSVFPGLPAAPTLAERPWEPDLAHTRTLSAFTARVLADYRSRYGDSPALAGVYQSFETTLKGKRDTDPVITLYRAQHAVVGSALPGRKILVSPYWDARRDRGFPPGEAGAGFADIAATRAGSPMAIAPQDGRGVGKVGLYLPDEAGERVDPRVAPVVGEVSNEEAYFGSIRDYYRAAGRARDALDGVELWMNLEAMEPTALPGECGAPPRARTTGERVDRQLMVAGPHVEKVVGYAWDPFLRCRSEDGSPPLHAELAAAWDRPIIVSAAERSRGGRPGVEVQGYNLAGATLRLTHLRPGDDAPQAVSAPLAVSAPPSGRPYPAAFQSAWAPVVPDGIDPDRPWARLTAISPAGGASTGSFPLRY
ncbi:hypothetical protein [Bailinhaonella thermotolerans]|uniref:Uncharacterized protein n=1 Tax=Bailinhaonella thermotolerans TaxID=1070861 RepID=A0A3A4ACW9_9ACTN|nr:hypothetical protein [Bailinhaonella thermotolerans]RJL24444.1 hypothetical protein D5H75_29400 [Bailinhaonella thermotolerans]